jgi:hypothetical protein
MRFRACLLICGAALLVAACFLRRSGDQVVPLPADSRLYYDDGPAFTDSTRRVIRDAAEWREVWEQATSTQSDTVALPDVDFRREMVLVVAAGRATPGDQIQVDSVGARGKEFVAVVRIMSECRRFSGAVYPLVIVRVRRSERPVTFVERRERSGECS